MPLLSYKTVFQLVKNPGKRRLSEDLMGVIGNDNPNLASESPIAFARIEREPNDTKTMLPGIREFKSLRQGPSSKKAPRISKAPSTQAAEGIYLTSPAK